MVKLLSLATLVWILLKLLSDHSFSGKIENKEVLRCRQFTTKFMGIYLFYCDMLFLIPLAAAQPLISSGAVCYESEGIINVLIMIIHSALHQELPNLLKCRDHERRS